MNEKIRDFLPNIFTLGNLSCGVLSLLMTYEGTYKYACLFIILAALLDRYDGRIARALNVTNDIGKELDSLADLISFGVAPSLLVFNMNNFGNLGIIGYISLIIFPVAGAYRLAKYNITDFTGVFTGIPITCAGMALAVYSLFDINRVLNVGITLVIVFLLSYLMVSRWKFKKV